VKIYISHSRGILDYKNCLYEPLRSSVLNTEHEIIFPHELSEEPYDSRGLLETLGLFGAEVSYPSTGLGIELGFAAERKVPIVCFHEHGTAYARSVKKVTEHIYAYTDGDDLVRQLREHISRMV
jgi:hypothetical protein